MLTPQPMPIIGALIALCAGWLWHLLLCGLKEVSYFLSIAIRIDNCCKVFYRRPILALAAMICEPELYEPDRDEEAMPPALAKYDLLRLESEADAQLAHKVIKCILDAYQLDLPAVQKELDQMGKNYKDGTASKISLSCLNGFSFF
jgi:hypothetical protein